ncbi:glycosyltransferase [Leifsonia sp. NPDC056665]|uniref:glycosyltransferase n=1 Tax=Leifsonia sp. NPDC056665 TaxID=3345901 RepID=UPI0036C0537C
MRNGPVILDPSDAIRYSVVIPTYNRSELLHKTIASVLAASVERRDVEIVVVDDGSTDESAALVASVQSDIEVLYLRQPDRGFRAARARNLGMSVARGRTVLLLDCGVAVRANFFAVLDEHDSRNADVVVFPVAGFSNNDADDDDLTAAIAAVKDRDAASALAQGDRFRDIREPVFSLCADNLSALPAPWAIAWTCCLVVPRHGRLRDVWFDERFVGWGGEDLDFALQLEKAGAVFGLERRTGGLHLPHSKSEAANSKSSRGNKSYLHQKHDRADTELLQTVSAVDLNDQLLRRAGSQR